MGKRTQGEIYKSLRYPQPTSNLIDCSRLEWMIIEDTLSGGYEYYAMVMTGVSPNILLVAKETGNVLCIPSVCRNKDRYRFVRYLTIDESITIFGSADPSKIGVDEATAVAATCEEVEDEDVDPVPPVDLYDMESIPDLVGFTVEREGEVTFVVKNKNYLYTKLRGAYYVCRQDIGERHRHLWRFIEYAPKGSASYKDDVFIAAYRRTLT